MISIMLAFTIPGRAPPCPTILALAASHSYGGRVIWSAVLLKRFSITVSKTALTVNWGKFSAKEGSSPWIIRKFLGLYLSKHGTFVKPIDVFGLGALAYFFMAMRKDLGHAVSAT